MMAEKQSRGRKGGADMIWQDDKHFILTGKNREYAYFALELRGYFRKDWRYVRSYVGKAGKEVHVFYNLESRKHLEV